MEYKTRAGASLTGSIRRSKDVALVVEAAAVIAGIKRLRVFLPGFSGSEMLEYISNANNRLTTSVLYI